jgi:hypothetical protein
LGGVVDLEMETAIWMGGPDRLVLGHSAQLQARTGMACPDCGQSSLTRTVPQWQLA